MLDGFRGGKPVDRNAVVDILLGLARLMVARPEIAEIDLNPVFLYDHGVAIADARIVLTSP